MSKFLIKISPKFRAMTYYIWPVAVMSLAFFIVTGVLFAATWVEPTANPPGNNREGYIFNYEGSGGPQAGASFNIGGDGDVGGNLRVGGSDVCVSNGSGGSSNCSAAGFWTQTGIVLRPNNLSWDVGVGTASPGATLHIHSGTDAETAIFEGTYGPRLRLYRDSVPDAAVRRLGEIHFGAEISPSVYAVGASILSQSTGSAWSGTNNAANLQFRVGKEGQAGTTEVMRIYDGKVGIGTTNPNRALHVATPAGTNAEIDIQTGSLNHWAIYHDQGTEDLRFWNADAPGDQNVLTLDNVSGAISIASLAGAGNCDDPVSDKLYTNASGQIICGTDQSGAGGADSDWLVVGTGATPGITDSVYHNGRVAINKTTESSASYALEVEGQVLIGNSTDGTLKIGGSTITNNSGTMWIDPSPSSLLQVPDTFAAVQIGVNDSTPDATLDVQGNIIAGGSATTPHSPINTSYEVIRAPGANSDYIIAVQDGNGRIQHKWNATAGASETYLVSGEPAWFWDVGVTGNPYMEFKFAPAGTAGNPIAWQSHMAFESTGNVGIGTTNPDEPLHIIADDGGGQAGGAGLLIENNFVPPNPNTHARIRLKAGDDCGGTCNGEWWIQRVGSGTLKNTLEFWSGFSRQTILTTGQVGFSDPTPDFQFEIAKFPGGMEQGSGYFGISSSVGGFFGQGPDIVQGDIFMIDLNGNVGINNQTPVEKLDVVGNIKATGSICANGGADCIGAGGGFDGDWIISGNNMYSAVTGNVGIGTTNPSVLLDVYGAGGSTEVLNVRGRIRSNSAAGGIWLNDLTTGNDRAFVGNSGSITGFWTGGVGWNALAINKTTGNVGIGTTAPGAKLDVAGGLRVDAASGINSNNNNIRFHTTQTDDGNAEWVGFYSGTARQGIIFYDGAWTSCNNKTDEFCLKAEAGNDLTLESDSDVLITPTGNVGIGTANPAYDFVVADPALGSDTLMAFQNDTTGSGLNRGFMIGIATDENAYIWQQEVGKGIAIGVNDGIGGLWDDAALIIQSDKSVTVLGDFYAIGGTKNFIQDHPNDPTKQIIYTSLEGPESGTYTRGSGQLINGQAVIELPEHFSLVTNEQGVTVQVTPTGETKGLYVAEKSTKKIVIKEISGGTGNATFDYLVQGVRLGYEDRPVIIDKKIGPGVGLAQPIIPTLQTESERAEIEDYPLIGEEEGGVDEDNIVAEPESAEDQESQSTDEEESAPTTVPLKLKWWQKLINFLNPFKQ